MDRTDTARDALLCSLRSADPDGAVESLRALTPVDRKRLVAKAVCHNVAPLVYRNLRRLRARTALPVNVLEPLREIYEANTIRMLRVYRELARVLETLRAEGVRVIVLKGAHLAWAVYDDIGLRPMCDVDLLVREADLHAARQSLLAIGYDQPQYRHDDLKHLHPFTKAGAIPIEVHWTLATEPEPLVANRDSLFERAVPFGIGEHQALGLCPDDLFLHLCFHAAHHGFVLGLQPLCDIVEMVRVLGDRLDWDAIRSRARLWRIERSLFLTLHLAGLILEPVGPGEEKGILEPDRSGAPIARVAMEQVLSVEDDRAMPPPPPVGESPPRRTIRLVEKGRILLKTLFPPRETMRVVYQTDRILPAYLLRPIDLFARYTRLGRKLFRRRAQRARSAGERLRTLRNMGIIRDWILSGTDRSERR